MVEKKMVEKKENEFKIDLEEMAKAGLHFGHRTSKCHPKMRPYLAGIKNTIHIIDIEKTAQKLKEALRFIQELITQNKTLLLVGTKVQFKDLVENTAIELSLPYVSERWLGGTFTNFEVMKKRIEHLKELEKKVSNLEIMEKYTKKERAKMEEELRELKLKFGGIESLESLPDAVFVLDMKKDEIVIREAERNGIKIIGLAHTNVDPTLADFPIPANDDAISSVKYILEKVKEAILKVKSKVTSNK